MRTTQYDVYGWFPGWLPFSVRCFFAEEPTTVAKDGSGRVASFFSKVSCFSVSAWILSLTSFTYFAIRSSTTWLRNVVRSRKRSV